MLDKGNDLNKIVSHIYKLQFFHLQTFTLNKTKHRFPYV